jgi:tetratricopeptide (TPR) repeat protein
LPNTITHIEDLINQGKYFEARTKAEEALTESNELRLKQLYALSISKSGAPESGLEYMEPVYNQFPDDPESAGILGSIYKELFKKNQRTDYAIKSRDTYVKNFLATKNYYTGINAASMSAMGGQAGKGREIATEVISLIENSAEDDFWKLATLGEAYILTKNRSRATEQFIKARRLANNDWGKITSVHNQLWLLNHFVPVSGEVLKMFSPPAVVAFIGHMIDHPSRSTPRFPASIEKQVKDSIVHVLQTLNARIGYCSLACGGDILFAEAMVDAGGEVNIFLPFSESDFIEQSVRFAGEEWVKRYFNLIEKFPPTYITKEAYAGFDDLFAYQNRVISGLAALRSASHHAEPTLLTVLSEVDLKRKKGGTRDTIHLWPFPQHYVNINPDNFVKSQSQVPVSAHVEEKPETEKIVERIDRPVLYVVHVNTGTLATLDREKLLKETAERIVEEAITIKSYELGEDYLLAGFDTELEAMEFVRLSHKLQKPVNQGSAIRIGLHAGPVYMDSASISLDKKLSGENIELVKAMNALTTPGSIFASNYFAALLALEQEKYSIDYAGILTDQHGHGKAIYKVGFKIH